LEQIPSDQSQDVVKLEKRQTEDGSRCDPEGLDDDENLTSNQGDGESAGKDVVRSGSEDRIQKAVDDAVKKDDGGENVESGA